MFFACIIFLYFSELFCLNRLLARYIIHIKTQKYFCTLFLKDFFKKIEKERSERGGTGWGWGQKKREKQTPH